MRSYRFLATAAERIRPTMRKHVLILTDPAASRVRRLLEHQQKPFLRLGVITKGCNEEKGKFDELIEEKGVSILVVPKALMHVIGTKMDFVDDKLRSEFVFTNPNSTGKCGCGESFMTT